MARRWPYSPLTAFVRLCLPPNTEGSQILSTPNQEKRPSRVHNFSVRLCKHWGHGDVSVYGKREVTWLESELAWANLPYGPDPHPARQLGQKFSWFRKINESSWVFSIMQRSAKSQFRNKEK